ncbi:MAG: Ig-like domain-containing protein [Deltaproteobacteria bacterium]|nr:MAG: Ig-like domain-containing protein [Deltaproteobacteria bacterium]
MARAGSLIYGDAQRDGDVDITDNLMIRQNAGNYPGVPLVGNADSSGHDCRLAVSDALAISQYLNEFHSDLPVINPPACWGIGLTATGGDGQEGPPGQTLPLPLEVTLENLLNCTQTISGCTLGGVTITYEISGDTTGGATLPGSVTTLDKDTDSSGKVSDLTLIMGPTVGAVTVVASVSLSSATGVLLTTISAIFTATAIECSIDSVGPNTGCAGVAVTISGSYFGPNTGTVTFDSTGATVASWGNTSIIVEAPGGDYSNVTLTPTAGGPCSLGGVYSYDDQVPTGLMAAPAGGSYCPTMVSLSASDGTIYYTLDGTEPDTGSMVYGAPIDISISTTLKFMAVDSCGNQASTLTEVYDIDDQAPAGLAASPAGGSYCATLVSLSASDGTIYYTLDGSDPTTGGPAGDIFNDDFESGDLIVGGWTSTGMVSVENRINDLEPVSVYNAYFVQTGEIWKSIDTTGYVNIQISYQFATHGLDAGENFIFEISTDGGGAWTEVEAFGAGMGESGWLPRDFDLSALYPSLGVENNPGFAIRFRQDADSFLDASDLDNVVVSATSSSLVYSGPLTIDIDMTLKFMAVDACGNQSGIVTENYTIDTAAPTGLTAIPAGGSYCTTAVVPVSLSVSDGTIYYTTDGTDPIPAGPVVGVFSDDFESGNLIDKGWTSAGMVSVENRINDLEPGSVYNAYFIQTGEIWKSVDTTGYGSIRVGYQFATHGLDAGENLIFEISVDGGGAWTEVEAFGAGVGESGWLPRDFDLSALSLGVEDNPAFAIRFRQNADSFLDASDLDNVMVSASLLASPVYSGTIDISMGTTLKFTAADACGNQSAIVTETYDTDLVVPTVSIVSPTDGACLNDTTVVVSGTADDGTGSGITAVFVNGRTVSGTYSWSITLSNSQYGEPIEVGFQDTADYAYGVFVSGDYAYVADRSSGLAIIDVSDPANPGIPVYRNTSADSNRVYVTGGYAYVTGGSGLAIINVSDPLNPGTPVYRDTSGQSWGVYVTGDYAYLGARSNGLAIINVSNPASPGTPVYEDTIDDAYDIYVTGGYAYLATRSSGLAIINVSDPTNPGTPVYRDTSGDGYGVHVTGGYAYLADRSSGLAIIDVSDPVNPGTPVYRDTLGYSYAVYVTGGYAYVADGGAGLTIINVSDPTNPGTPVYQDTPGNSMGVYVTGGYAYVADNDYGLRVIDVSSFNFPVFSAIAVDNCGNVSDPAAVNVTIDTTANVTITSPGNGVTISAGDVFVGGTADTDITTVTVTSDQGHNVSSPVDPAGNWAVVLTGVVTPSINITTKGTDNCGNTESNSVTVPVVPPVCSITLVSPTTGCPGDFVQITGSGFGPGTPVPGHVYFNETEASWLGWNDTWIWNVFAPGGDFLIVTVTTATSGSCSLAGNYFYDNVPPDPPTITSPTDGSIFTVTTIDTDITCTEGSCSQRLDLGSWTSTCTTTFFGVTHGPHLLAAKCTDSCSNDSDIATSSFWVDTMAPWVTSTNPNSGQTGVPTGVNIEIQFSEDMDKGSVESGFTLSTGTSGPLSGNFYWRADDVVVFATPDLLTDDTTYTVDLVGAADLAGYSLTGTVVFFPFNFYTGDCTPPQVTSKDPDGTTRVDSSTLTEINIWFNELMDTTQGNMKIRDAFGQNVVETEIGGGGFGGTLTWSTGDTLTLTLSTISPIQEGNGYNIEAWSLNDQSGNKIWSGVRCSFVTYGPPGDTDPPQIVLSIPYDNQTGVPRKLHNFAQNMIYLAFDEVLDPSTVNQTNITLTDSAGPVSFDMDWIVGNGPSAFSVMIIPDLPLNPLETYTIGISGGLWDSAGNNFVPQTITFTTADEPDDTSPPLVEATVPADGWIDLDQYGIDGDIGFNEPIDFSTADITAINLKETNTGIPLKGFQFEGPYYNEGPTIWHLRFYSTRAFPDMEPNTHHTLTISSGSISDISGNLLADYSWGFTTVPDGPVTGAGNRLPRIWRVWPDLNAMSFENGNVTIELKIEARDDDGDPLTVWAEDYLSNSWTLTAPTGSDRYEYQTNVPDDIDSGNEPNITYDGWQTFTFYADDGQPDHTISVSNQVYIWPTVDLPNQVSPINGEVVTSGGPTTLVWQNVDTANAVFLMGQYYNLITGEQGMCVEFPEFAQTTLTGLSTGVYAWSVNQMAEIHGDSFEGGGMGVGYQGMGVSNFTVADPALGSISGTITYTGPATGIVFVEAYTNSTFTGDPVSLAVIPDPESYTIYNLPDDTYYVHSFRDTDRDMQYDDGEEPYGYYDPPSPADPVTITGGTNQQGIDIEITVVPLAPVIDSVVPPVMIPWTPFSMDINGSNFDCADYTVNITGLCGVLMNNPVSCTDTLIVRDVEIMESFFCCDVEVINNASGLSDICYDCLCGT